jgi:hypothetical protein
MRKCDCENEKCETLGQHKAGNCGHVAEYVEQSYKFGLCTYCGKDWTFSVLVRIR